MTSSEQFQQEIIGWINSDEAKREFHRSQNFSATSFPDALRYLYDYFDSKDVYGAEDPEKSHYWNPLELASGTIRRVEEKETASHLIVIFALTHPERKTQYYQVTSELVEDSNIYWKGASVKEVYPKRVTVYVDEPV